MVIECPNCRTRFRLDEARLSSRRAMLKCSRCRHIFPAPRDIASQAPPPARVKSDLTPPRRPERPASPDRPASKEENLSFTFGDEEDEWDAELLHAEVPEEQFSLEGEPEHRRPDRPVHASQVQPQAHFFPDEGEREEVEMDEVGEEFEAPDEAETPPSKPGISLRPVFLFLSLVVIGYAVLAATLYANQEWAEEVARSVPIIGSGSRDRFLSRKVTLMGFQGAFERTKNGTNIFVVTGNVTNHAAVALSGVQIRTRLLDRAGNLLDERVTFCGSAVPLKILHELSVAEVSIIGRLKPPKVFLVQPGEQSPCMAVFTDPSPQIAEITTQVVAAQRQA